MNFKDFMVAMPCLITTSGFAQKITAELYTYQLSTRFGINTVCFLAAKREQRKVFGLW